VLAKQNEKELGQSFDELFESYLNKSKYKEAHEFARRRGSKEERDWMLQLIKCEKIYCCELDEYLIPKSWSLWKKQKTAEEQFAMAKTLFEPIDFLVDYCRCRIYLISLFKVHFKVFINLFFFVLFQVTLSSGRKTQFYAALRFSIHLRALPSRRRN